MSYVAAHRKPDFARTYASWLLDQLFPPCCPISGEAVNRQGALHPDVWKDLVWISTPQCQTCGIPFEADLGLEDTDLICGKCLKDPPVFHKARSALVYAKSGRSLILSFKHGDRTMMAPMLATWMAQSATEILGDTDIIIPVPLHYLRLLRRRYNQAALLGAELARKTGIVMRADLLIRHRYTAVQGKNKKISRKDNVKNAFTLNPKKQHDIRGKTILLIDDVYTSGATIESCTKPLLKAGAAQVNVLTLARVI